MVWSSLLKLSLKWSIARINMEHLNIVITFHFAPRRLLMHSWSLRKQRSGLVRKPNRSLMLVLLRKLRWNVFSSWHEKKMFSPILGCKWQHLLWNRVHGLTALKAFPTFARAVSAKSQDSGKASKLVWYRGKRKTWSCYTKVSALVANPYRIPFTPSHAGLESCSRHSSRRGIGSCIGRVGFWQIATLDKNRKPFSRDMVDGAPHSSNQV